MSSQMRILSGNWLETGKVQTGSITWLEHILQIVHSGEYAYQAKIGKVLVKRMSDPQKLELIANHGAHIAHHGEIIPDEAYRIDRDKTHLLNRDGSNFFEHAERIK